MPCAVCHTSSIINVLMCGRNSGAHRLPFFTIQDLLSCKCTTHSHRQSERFVGGLVLVEVINKRDRFKQRRWWKEGKWVDAWREPGIKEILIKYGGTLQKRRFGVVWDQKKRCRQDITSVIRICKEFNVSRSFGIFNTYLWNYTNLRNPENLWKLKRWKLLKPLKYSLEVQDI